MASEYVFKIWPRLWMTLIETSSRQTFGYYITSMIKPVPSRSSFCTHIAEDILLTKIVDLRRGFNTGRTSAADNETQKPFTLFGRDSGKRSSLKVV